MAWWEDEKQRSPGGGRHRRVGEGQCTAGHLPALPPSFPRARGRPGLRGSPLPGLGGKTEVTQPSWTLAGAGDRSPSFCCCWRDSEGQLSLWLPGLGEWWPWARGKRGALPEGTHCHTTHRLTGRGCAQTHVLYPHVHGDRTQTLLTVQLTRARACTRTLTPRTLLRTHTLTPSPLKHGP